MSEAVRGICMLGRAVRMTEQTEGEAKGVRGADVCKLGGGRPLGG